MTYQEQYLKSQRLFSPTSYDQLEHLAQNTGTWRMATFKIKQGLAHKDRASVLWNIFKTTQEHPRQHPKAFATNTKTSKVWNIFKTTQGHFAHNNCKEVA